MSLPGEQYHYQMSLAGGIKDGVGIPEGEGDGYPRGSGYPKGGYHSYPIMQVIYLSPTKQNDRQTPVKTLPSRKFVGGG